MIVPVFGLKIDINVFAVCLLSNKLNKPSELVKAKLNKQSTTLLEAGTSIKFLSFSANLLSLDWIIIQLLLDIVAKFLFGCLDFDQKTSQ